MKTPKRIAFVSQDLCFGGTQRQMLELAARIDRTRFSPEIWTLTGPTDLEEFAAEKNLPVVHLGKARTPQLSFLYTLFRETIRRKPDLFVPGTAIPNIWCRIYGKLLGIPTLGTVRGGDGPRLQHEWLLWRLAEHMMCNSTPLHTILLNLGVPADKLTYIANGVDTERYTPAPTPLAEREPLILAVGRLVTNKNHFLLLDAFELVIQEFPQARLRIVGDGELKDALCKRIRDSKYLKNTVEVLPASLDVRPHYGDARIFALSSIKEGQPNVVLEALSSGLPVVSTDVGGACVDIIGNGNSGLITPQNDAKALAANILLLLRDPELCVRLGTNGRKLVLERFSFSAMVQAHENIFDKLLIKAR